MINNCNFTHPVWYLTLYTTILYSLFIKYLIFIWTQAIFTKKITKYLYYSSRKIDNSTVVNTNNCLFRIPGHGGQSVQQVLQGHGRLRGHVLWAGLRHHAHQARHQVRMQVQVVLRRGVQRLRGGGGRSHLQASQETGLAGRHLTREPRPIGGPRAR